MDEASQRCGNCFWFAPDLNAGEVGGHVVAVRGPGGKCDHPVPEVYRNVAATNLTRAEYGLNCRTWKHKLFREDPS